MRTHELKTWPSYFAALAAGDKTFEVRENDRDFAVGDLLVLKEYDPAVETHVDRFRFTGREMHYTVSYVMHGGRFGLDARYCILGLRPRAPGAPTPTED